MEETAASLEPGTRIKDRWSVVYKIGRGASSSVYEMRVLTREAGPGRVALKAEAHKKDKKSKIKMELAVLKALAGNKHVPHLLACGVIMVGDSAKFNYVVMDLVGPNINQLRFQCPNDQFTPATSIRILIQCLEAVRDLHNVGYLHRDIKPGNFAMGASEKNEDIIYMLDYGLARKYLDIDKDGNKRIREPRQRAFFCGTVRYCSSNVHKRLEQGRHDDLCSWLYMAVELMGGLPWTRTRDRDQVANMKETISTETLLEHCPHEFVSVADHIEALSYKDEPSYGWILEQLWKAMDRNGFRDKDPYDWQEGGAVGPIDLRTIVSHGSELSAKTEKMNTFWEEDASERN